MAAAAGAGHPVIAGLLMLGVGSIVAWDGLWRWWLARASLTWPAVRGQVVSATVTEVKGRSTTFPLRLRYRYEVAGQPFECERISFRPVAPTDPVEADSLLRYYTSRPWLEVRYDPSRPGMAVLEAGESGHPLLTAIVGLFLAGLGLIQAISSI